MPINCITSVLVTSNTYLQQTTMSVPSPPSQAITTLETPSLPYDICFLCTSRDGRQLYGPFIVKHPLPSIHGLKAQVSERIQTQFGHKCSSAHLQLRRLSSPYSLQSLLESGTPDFTLLQTTQLEDLSPNENLLRNSVHVLVEVTGEFCHCSLTVMPLTCLL